MSRSDPEGKPFAIPKALVWQAWKQVKANKGAAGVDRCSIEEFEEDLGNNLYRIWNRMSSGTYFPPPVRAVVNGHRDFRLGGQLVSVLADVVSPSWWTRIVRAGGHELSVVLARSAA